MNETLQQALAEILTKAAETAGQAKDFVLAEMPDVVQQLLVWKMAESVIFCVFGLALLILVPVYWCFVKRKWDSIAKSGSEPGVVVGGLVVSLGFTITGLSLFNLTWLQIWLAPKIYLIEYAAQLVKQ